MTSEPDCGTLLEAMEVGILGGTQREPCLFSEVTKCT